MIQTVAGRLRHRIKIQSLGLADDGMGGQTEAWSDMANVWASIEPLTGKELFIAQQVESNVTHKITMRYLAGITTKHRILFGSRVFEIVSIRDEEERNKVLEIFVTE